MSISSMIFSPLPTLNAYKRGLTKKHFFQNSDEGQSLGSGFEQNDSAGNQWCLDWYLWNEGWYR